MIIACSYERNLSNGVKKSEKVRTSTGFDSNNNNNNNNNSNNNKIIITIIINK